MTKQNSLKLALFCLFCLQWQWTKARTIHIHIQEDASRHPTWLMTYYFKYFRDSLNKAGLECKLMLVESYTTDSVFYFKFDYQQDQLKIRYHNHDTVIRKIPQSPEQYKKDSLILDALLKLNTSLLNINDFQPIQWMIQRSHWLKKEYVKAYPALKKLLHASIQSSIDCLSNDNSYEMIFGSSICSLDGLEYTSIKKIYLKGEWKSDNIKKYMLVWKNLEMMVIISKKNDSSEERVRVNQLSSLLQQNSIKHRISG